MLERLWKKIVISDRFSLWSIPAFVLWLASFPYRLLFALKKSLVTSAEKLPVPVVSVGNLTVGGSGKTPVVECIGSGLIREGIRVGVVCSGYGRHVHIPVLEPGYRLQEMEVAQVGDEAKLLASSMPEALFAIDRSKSGAAARLAQTNQVDVIVVDDGYQHFALPRDIDLVTYDAAVRRRQLKLFPRGVLREPLWALRRSDIIIITRSNFAKDLNRLRQRLRSFAAAADIYHAQFGADELIGRDQRRPVKYLEDKSVFLFAGVGNFSALKRQVAALAADVDFELELSDHQRYDQRLLKRMKRVVDAHDSDVIVTTAKDWVKLVGFDFGREIYYLNLYIDLDPGEEKLIQAIKKRLGLSQQEN
jgi:tetraacyldisaccharide 4'-kinase